MLKNNTPEDPKRQPGSRQLTKAQLKGLQGAHKRHIIPDRGGWHDSRAAQDWIRPGFETQCPSLRGTELMSAVIFMAFRQNKPWTSSDGMTMSDLVARSFGADYLARRRLSSRPSWLEKVVRGLHEGATMPYKAGYLEFVGDLLRAKRVGAVSIFMSQTEAAELYGCNERTFRRWVILAEDLGVVSMVQTWAKNNGVRRNAHRRFGKVAYIAGPALVELVGPAVYEGLDEAQLRGGKRTCTAARRRAQDLRKESLEEFRRGRDAAWRGKNGRPDPSSLSPDIVPAPPSPFGSEIGGSRSGSVEERPAAASMPASPDRGEKLHAPDRAEPGVASPESNTKSENQAPTPPECTPDHRASKSTDGAWSAIPSMGFADGLARLQTQAKGLRRALHLLVFFLTTLTMGCGAMIDEQARDNKGAGDRSRGRSRGVSLAPPGVGGASHGRDARFWKGRGYPRYHRHGVAGHGHENGHKGRSAGRSQPIHRSWRKQMEETTEKSVEIDILDATGFSAHLEPIEAGRMKIRGEGMGSTQNFVWDNYQRLVVQMRRISGWPKSLPGQRKRPPIQASIDGYAFCARAPGSEWKKYDKIPRVLEPGKHRVQLSSPGAETTLFELICKPIQPDAPVRVHNEPEPGQADGDEADTTA